MSEQLTERYCVLVNGHAVEPGCWVDGHWGQYGPDHLADRASELGWEPGAWNDDPNTVRAIIDTIETTGYGRYKEVQDLVCTFWEWHSEAATDIETWLNDHTETEGYSWGWHDGEFYLWPTETWEETDA